MRQTNKYPRPTLILLHKEYEHGSVTFTADPYSKDVGVLIPQSSALRRAASKSQKEQVRAWRLIQRERMRLGLPLLTSEEMEVF